MNGKASFSSYRIDELARRTDFLPLGIMLVGATGAGKSTTINALAGENISAVGRGVNPETMKTKSYRLNKFLRIYDTPGLGDSPEQDENHKKQIRSLLRRKYTKDNVECGKVVDIALVVIDGSTRDLGTVFSTIKNVILPELGEQNILLAVNQADMAMKGRHFNQKNNTPDATLTEFLENQADVLQRRIQDFFGTSFPKPVFYSAKKKFNLELVIDSIIDNKNWKMRKFGTFQRTLIHKSATRSLSAQKIYSGEDDSDDIVDILLSPIASFIEFLGDIFY